MTFGEGPPALQRSRLLVSVRSAAEAESALAGGAEVIDVKEPENGPLGCADDEVIAAVVAQVAGRVPVSAALGELADVKRQALSFPNLTLHFVKWGLAGCRDDVDWRQQLEEQRLQLVRQMSRTQLVIAAYADWALAQAPPLAEVVAFACQRPGAVLLMDTFVKHHGANLLQWLSPAQLLDIRRRCRAAQVSLALAGSLGKQELLALRDVQPDWFAVRGAACRAGRLSAVCADRVRELVGLLNSSTPEGKYSSRSA
jgi:uncharacterized protein (UPF0264 family)